MRLRMHRAPGSAPGGLVWATPEDVVEVPDELAVDLIAIPGAGFEHVPHLDVTAPAEVAEAPVVDGEADAAEVAEAPAKRKYTRRATPDAVTE